MAWGWGWVYVDGFPRISKLGSLVESVSSPHDDDDAWSPQQGHRDGNGYLDGECEIKDEMANEFIG